MKWKSFKTMTKTSGAGARTGAVSERKLLLGMVPWWENRGSGGVQVPLRHSGNLRIDLRLGPSGMGGDMITMTSGEISGWLPDAGGDFYKTSAKGGPGVSGGAAFDAHTGKFVGVPTAGTIVDSGDTLGLIRPNSYILQLLVAAEQSG